MCSSRTSRPADCAARVRLVGSSTGRLGRRVRGQNQLRAVHEAACAGHPRIRWRRTPASGSRSSRPPKASHRRTPQSACRCRPTGVPIDLLDRRRQRAREEDARAHSVSPERVQRRGSPLRFPERTGSHAVRIDQTAGTDLVEHKRSDYRRRADSWVIANVTHQFPV